MMSSATSLEINYQLEGWQIFSRRLTVHDGAEGELAALCARVAEGIRERHELPKLASHPTVAALRKLFRQAGCDPTRYRPSSEALLRRLLKGSDLPTIHPLVDLNNCFSAELAVPCCVMAQGTFSSPLTLRAGQPGEAYESLRGPFKLEKKPLLVDAEGPVDSPITGSQRVKVTSGCREAWLAAYLPAEAVSLEEAEAHLARLLKQAPVAALA